MKRIFGIIVLLVFTLFISGCTDNEININNQSYEKIDNIYDFEELIVTVIEKTDNAVIGVSNYKKSLFGALSLQGVGSGAIYKAVAHMKDGTVKEIRDTIDSNQVEIYEYYAVTNRHVIEEAGEVYAYLGHHDTEVVATVLSADDKVDLAIIKFRYYTYIEPLKFGDSDQVKRGSFAIAIGSPSGYDYYGTATFGTISHEKRYLADIINDDGSSEWDAQYIQHDVSINPGNSGGPLLNLNGEIIGINTMKLVSSKIEKMGFSIPSNVILDLIPILEKGLVPQRALLGVSVRQIGGSRGLSEADRIELGIPDSIDHGFYVTAVVANGVAHKSGIISGDIIVSFNDIEIKYSHELRSELGKIIIGSGEIIEIGIYRNGEYLKLPLKF